MSNTLIKYVDKDITCLSNIAIGDFCILQNRSNFPVDAELLQVIKKDKDGHASCITQDIISGKIRDNFYKYKIAGYHKNKEVYPVSCEIEINSSFYMLKED